MADRTSPPHIISYAPPYDPNLRDKREYRWINKKGSIYEGKGCSFKYDTDGKTIIDYKVIPDEYVYFGECQREPNKGRKYKCVRGVDGQFLLFKWLSDK